MGSQFSAARLRGYCVSFCNVIVPLTLALLRSKGLMWAYEIYVIVCTELATAGPSCERAPPPSGGKVLFGFSLALFS